MHELRHQGLAVLAQGPGEHAGAVQRVRHAMGPLAQVIASL